MENEICGLTAVVNICSLHGIRADFIELCKQAATTYGKDITLLVCRQALEERGIRSNAVRFKSITNLPEGSPLICVLRKKRGLHAVAALRRGNEVLLIDGQSIKRFSTDYIDGVTENVALVTQKVDEKIF
jgi:ABC-type bacteriocin/lantibiotic exporter with double-glycine peptidase domain